MEKHSQVDMSGAKYLLYLREKQDTMKQELLEFCRGKDAVTAAEAYGEMKGRYPLPEGKGKEENVILQGVLWNLLSAMASQGKLEEDDSEGGTRYRIPASQEDKTEAA